MRPRKTEKIGTDDLIRSRHQPLIGDGIVNDGSNLVLVVERCLGANTVEVTQAVEQAIEALKLGLTDVGIDSQIYRPTTFIEQATDTITSILIIGDILVLLALGAIGASWMKSRFFHFITVFGFTP